MRDSYVTGLIKHLESPSLYLQPDNFSKADIRHVDKEVERCQESFEYTSRNYLYIVNKERQDVLLDLWPSQEIILDRMYALKARGRAQRIQIIKARQVGASHLVEGLGAWKMMFFPNQNGLVVADVDARSTYLFGLMLHMYENLPWWLKPLVRSKKYEEGLHFANPDTKTQDAAPGLNSKVFVSSAKDLSGVGTGFTLTFSHASEYPLWDEAKAKEIIAGQLRYALVESPETIGVLEGTPKGARRYAHKLWKANLELGDKADWEPVFIPYFFEKRYVLAPEHGWRPEQDELDLREKARIDWMVCPKCGAYRQQIPYMGAVPGVQCNSCKQAELKEMVLSDSQLCYIWNLRINAKQQDEEALMNLRENICTTAEEAFQNFGNQVFPDTCHTFVARTVKKPTAIGFFDDHGHFHGVRNYEAEPGQRQCFQDTCKVDHSFDPCDLKIWEWPAKGSAYIAGVDVAAGFGGNNDYSTIVVNRIGANGTPDHQVCSYRNNTIDPRALAGVVYAVGKMYNEAMLAIEYNLPECANYVTQYYQYPNIYRWLHLDATNNIRSNRLHWVTNEKTKKRLWLTAISYLKQRLWVVRDETIGSEMKTYIQLRPGEEKVGTSCFLAGTKVGMADGTVKSIESIIAGESVMTSSGVAAPVARTLVRRYDGKMLKIKVTGVPDPIFCTPEHPFLVKFRNGGQSLEDAVATNPLKWAPASSLRPGDLATISAMKKERPDLTDEQMRAIGFWLAEGSYKKNHLSGERNGLSISNTEREFLVRTGDTLKEWFSHRFRFHANKFSSKRTLEQSEYSITSRKRQRHAWQDIYSLEFRSIEAAAWFNEHCGEYSHSKRLPTECVGAIGALPLVAGFIDGDGSIRKNNERDINIYTCSSSIAWQIVRTVHANGIWATVSRQPPRKDGYRGVYTINIKNSGAIQIPTIKPQCSYDYKIKNKTRTFFDGCHYYPSIESIEVFDVSDSDVYNLEVSGDDHTYTVCGVNVHNCDDHDDLLTAGMIALVCAHETDVHSGESSMTIPLGRQADPEGDFQFNCASCGHQWSGTAHNHYSRCVSCSSAYISVKRKVQELNVATIDWDESPTQDQIARRMEPPDLWQGSVDSIGQLPYDQR